MPVHAARISGHQRRPRTPIQISEGGCPIEDICPGDIAWLEPGEKHWHRAASTTAMTHVAIAEMQGGSAVTWMENVTDDQYLAGRNAH